MSADTNTELARAVLGYLAEHPDAMDTPEGITEWWLMRQHVRVQVEAVEQVLRELAESGVIEQIGTGEQRRYRLKRE